MFDITFWNAYTVQIKPYPCNMSQVLQRMWNTENALKNTYRKVLYYCNKCLKLFYNVDISPVVNVQNLSNKVED